MHAFAYAKGSSAYIRQHIATQRPSSAAVAHEQQRAADEPRQPLKVPSDDVSQVFDNRTSKNGVSKETACAHNLCVMAAPERWSSCGGQHHTEQADSKQHGDDDDQIQTVRHDDTLVQDDKVACDHLHEHRR